MIDSAQVVVVAAGGDVGQVLPPDHTLSVAAFDAAADAFAHISELRARAIGVVLVLDSAGRDVVNVVMEAGRRYPEVAVIVASHPGLSSPAPSRAVVRLSGSVALETAIRAALRAASQQARVRTTLDRLNVQLRAQAPPAAPQHRRLILSGLYLAAILEQTGDGIFITDRSGTIALWNRAAGQLFGVDNPTGRRVDEAIEGDGGTALLAVVRGLSPQARARSHAMVHAGPGGPREVEVSLSLISDAQGNGMAVSCIARDVTRERALHRELEFRAEALARSNRHKDDFLAVLSHELRTPLNAVLGWTHILATTTPDAAQTRRATEMIARNAELQRRLVEDLLDYARIAAGRLPIRLEPVDVGEVVRAAVDAIRPTLDASALRVLESYEPGLAAAIDRDRFRQVITNLMTNAVKFTPPDGEVRVTARREGDEIRIAVTDNGQGIVPEFLPYVFDEFRQADPSATRVESGLGLGLAIARRIVELHGGSITVTSDGPGTGATFLITLPSTKAGIDKA